MINVVNAAGIFLFEVAAVGILFWLISLKAAAPLAEGPSPRPTTIEPPTLAIQP